LSQVIKKRRIVLASVLKPVDDTRMFEKLAPTLAEDETFEISIIGYPSAARPTHPAIKLIPLPSFDRLSFKRLMIPWIVFIKINKLDPEIIVINTPELLFIAVLSRVFYGRKIVYDVLENYYRTIRFTTTYPVLLKWVLAGLVRITETITRPFIHHYVLAENGYVRELNFAKPNLILQNKLPKSIASKHSTKRSGKNSKMIFTGTLAETTGVFEAIELYKALHKIDASHSLTIIGYCAIPETLSAIKKEISIDSSITLIGGNVLVPHDKILNEIGRADIGIIIYPPNPSTGSSISTKLYEYLALQLPVLIRHNRESHELVQLCQAGIVLDETPNYTELSETLKIHRFAPVVSELVFWENEAKNLISRLNLK
jgi:hypothetical protein